MFQTFIFFKIEQLTFSNDFVEQLLFEQLYILVWNLHLLNKTCTAYFFDFRADSNIFVICSNSVEQSRFWCRADDFRADDFWADYPSPIINENYFYSLVDDLQS